MREARYRERSAGSAAAARPATPAGRRRSRRRPARLLRLRSTTRCVDTVRWTDAPARANRAMRQRVTATP